MSLVRPAAVVLILLSFPLPVLAGELFQLTTSSAADRHPSWSPSGDLVVFESNRSGRWQLYRMSVAGGEPEQITFGNYDHQMAEISPDGTQIAFCGGFSTLEGLFAYSGLYVMPATGGDPTLLFPSSGHITWHPSYTPDGHTIYFTCRVDDGHRNNWSIYKISSTGGPAELVSDLGDEVYTDVSPDGTQLLYSTRPVPGSYNLVEAPVYNPTDVTYLTLEEANTSQGAYSPDGSLVVFVSRKDTGFLELYEMDRETESTIRLTFDGESGGETLTQFPQYSPDGRLIAFSSARATGDENVWVMSREGGFPGENTLVIGSGQGLPGGEPVAVPVHLLSFVSSPALEFRVHDLPDHLRITGVRMSGRAGAMVADFAENAGTHVLVYSPSGIMIPAGSGRILDLLVEVRNGVLGETIELVPSQAVMADRNGDSVELELLPGSFLVERLLGDITGDNFVDVGDLVRLVEIILDTGAPPSADELEAADCNGDESWNALDVACLTDLILGGPAVPGGFERTSAGVELVVNTAERVRGLQFTVDPSRPGVTSTAELEPLSLFSLDSGRQVVAFDPLGGQWEPGIRTPLLLQGTPAEVRAYGPGGRRLPVDVSGNEIRIGKPIPAGLHVIAPKPNPFHSTTVVFFSTDVSTVIRLSVYDIRGRRVSSTPEISVTPGTHSVTWEARDASGRTLPAGVYVGVIDGGVRRASTRLIHLGK